MLAKHSLPLFTLALALSAIPALRAQQTPPPPPQQAGPPPQPPGGRGRRGPGPGRADSPLALHLPPGRWWDDPSTAQSLALTPAQIQQLDQTFNGARDHLIDLDANLRKADADLQPLLAADPINRADVLAQVDRLTEAQAALEKANATMLLDLRLHLTRAQWSKLQSLRPPRPPQPFSAHPQNPLPWPSPHN